MKRNPNLGSSVARAKKRRLFWVRFYIILFFVLAITFTLAIFSGHSKVIIKQINVSGQASISTEQILDVVNKNLAGRYFYLFARNNYLIFPRFTIQQDLLNEFKIFKAVDVSWSNWGTIDIKVSERKPHSVWCGADPADMKADCYFIDRTGYIFNRAPTFSGDIFVRNYRALDTSSPIGQYFLASNLYLTLYRLIDVLAKNNLTVQRVSFDNFDYKFYLATGPTIIFNQKSNLDATFANLITAINSGDLDLVNNAEKINYIDLRFGDKIVVGKKGE
ncbi:MAG: hypothetical protein WC027_00510 [Candidatus Paceibacterota bacterium]